MEGEEIADSVPGLGLKTLQLLLKVKELRQSGEATERLMQEHIERYHQNKIPVEDFDESKCWCPHLSAMA